MRAAHTIKGLTQDYFAEKAQMKDLLKKQSFCDTEVNIRFGKLSSGSVSVFVNNLIVAVLVYIFTGYLQCQWTLPVILAT